MSKLSKQQLADIVTSSIIDAGWDVIRLNRSSHPFRFNIYNDQEAIKVRIYIWNITHGGGHARPEHEYRIQITGFEQFEPEPDGKTLILGWWDESQLFAGFDYNKHSGHLGASPSFQIRKECLDQAYISGFAPCLKENNEIAIAFKPDMLVEYVQNLDALHGFGNSKKDTETLSAVASDPRAVNTSAISKLPARRQIVVASVQQRLRVSSFRRRVLTAYEHKCAFCGLQLDLIQAAHILPVADEDSNDETANGIAACYLHHAAYDQALITFDAQYHIITNENKLQHLIKIKRDGEMDRFRNELREMIILPPSTSDRPHVELVRKANKARGWEGL
jgi:putative restriction endonuclease